MKRVILLAAAGCLAVTVPALAASNSNAPAQPGAHQQSQNGSEMQAPDQQQQTIQSSSLSKQQVREIQSSLDKSGFNAKHVDGIWGTETRDALRDFQQAKNLPGNGKLNQQTLSALGVNVGNQPQGADANRNASSGKQEQSQTVGQSRGHGTAAQGARQNMNSK